MKRLGWAVALGMLLTAGGALAQTGGWVRLYNGRDLSGWQVRGGKAEAWKADGELLRCVAPGGGWLVTQKEYGDFELRLEYRIPPGGNSGVGLRIPPQGDPAHVAMEIQILDDPAPQYKNLKHAQYNGGIYYQSPAKIAAAKPPGQWNRYEIFCQGPIVAVYLNGVEVQNVNLDAFTAADGGYTPLAKRPRRGTLGLQSHGDPVEFRNLEVRELSGR